MSLNPCCGGRCSSTDSSCSHRTCYLCLNPCCGGRCSSTPGDYKIHTDETGVLILVVVEDVLVRMVPLAVGDELNLS